jgi:putative transposase
MKTLNAQLTTTGKKAVSGRPKKAHLARKDKRKRLFKVYIDHTRMDLILSNAGRALGRPWLTLAIDENSHRVLAYYLTFDSPSYRSCLAVLREILRLYGRLPDWVVIDNSREFSSDCINQLAARNKIVIERRPLSMCRSASVIERMFAGINTAILKMLTNGSIDLFPETRRIRSAA